MSKFLSYAWLILKYVLPVIIVVAVTYQFYTLLSRPELWSEQLTLRPQWLLLSAILYLMAHTLFATFWVQLLRCQGAVIPWKYGVRAYFVSQLGKYVPGKALVILIRISMLRAYAPSRAVLALTATYETIGTMAAGAGVGVLLLPWLSADASVTDQRWPLLIIAALPLGFGLVHMVIRYLGAKYQKDMPQLPHLPFLLLARGLLQAAFGWVVMGLSLWAALQAILPEPLALNVTNWLRLTAIASMSYVIGFVVLVSPGGVGVREYFLQQMLTTELALHAGYGSDEAAGLAVVLAIVLRLTWTLAELVAIQLLYRYVRPPAVEGSAP